MSSQVIYAEFGQAGRTPRVGPQPGESTGTVAAIHPLPNWLRVAVDASHVDIVTRHRYPRADEKPAVLERYRAWLAPRIDAGQYIGYLAQIDGAIVAGAGLTLLDWGPTRESARSLRARLVNVFTQVGYRRQRIAHELICMLMTACDKRGIDQIDLSTSDAGHSFWAGLGFERVSSEMTLLL